MAFNLQDLKRMDGPDGRPGFDALPGTYRARVFGVPYAVLDDPNVGQLYITRYGWTFIEEILPHGWFANHRYREEGHRLPGSTGTVYFVPGRGAARQPVDLVVKFSRFAEDLPIQVSTIPDGPSVSDYAHETFNSPFEEFGVLMDLRRGRFGPSDLRIRTKRPLAIYCPPESHPLWRLGRSESRFRQYARDLEGDQADVGRHEKVRLDIARQYILLFQWVDGLNAEDLCDEGELTREELAELTSRVSLELRAKGFRVLDNKPKHFILRKTRNPGALITRRQLVYALVDFELLKRTSEYTRFLKERKKDRVSDHAGIR
jgi:hypothetical protein